MRVVTFNICHATRGRGTPVDHDALVAACVGFGADVLALQEVDRGTARSGRVDQARLVADATGLSLAFAPAHRVWSGAFGNALLVRGRLSDLEIVALRGRWRWGRRDRRSALLATVEVDGLRTSVAATHLSVDLLDNVAQEQVVLARLGARRDPALLLGDLNRRTAWVARGAAAVGFHLVDDDAPSAPAVHPRYRIDHVAVRGLRVERVEVVATGISDHRALVVDVEPSR